LAKPGESETDTAGSAVSVKHHYANDFMPRVL